MCDVLAPADLVAKEGARMPRIEIVAPHRGPTYEDRTIVLMKIIDKAMPNR